MSDPNIKTLAYNDLVTGCLFTVYESAPQLISEQVILDAGEDWTDDGDPVGTMDTTKQIKTYGPVNDRFFGVPMRFLAKSWPFVVGECLSTGGRCVVDLRTSSVCEISVDYALSLSPMGLNAEFCHKLADGVRTAEMERAAKAKEAAKGCEGMEVEEVEKKMKWPWQSFGSKGHG